MMKNNQLKAILWRYLVNEFEFDEAASEEYEKQFNHEFQYNQVSIAESTFGNEVTFDGTTTFIPESLKITKSILNIETEKSFVETIHFKNLNEVKNYFEAAIFDEHLAHHLMRHYSWS
ncbi:hypothetical protein W772_02488 [Staphylococcus aureus VET1048S]|nr:hypothetical protein W787_02579 [Staphylococcus aureus VET1422S]KAG50015.1 hypothetical protein W771_02507 [Staphylococcus aureus VET1035S]KAG53752.1 hypothetical protein W772_02488 [Staphylococcus aureus VET1048S]